MVGTDLCWTAPHQSPHSAPSDRTGSAWSHPQPPPPTGQPLWSTRTPPPLECRHLTETSTATSYFCGPSAITRSPGGGLFFSSWERQESRRERQKEVSHSHHLVLFFSFIFSPPVLSHLFHVNSACLALFVPQARLFSSLAGLLTPLPMFNPISFIIDVYEVLCCLMFAFSSFQSLDVTLCGPAI